MKKYLFLPLVAFLAFPLSQAQANNPFTDCGIGAALFPNNNVGAVISNVIWDAGTTAVTSATMSPETCNSDTEDTAKFILDSIDRLETDMALGKGEHMDALASLMQCANVADVNTAAAKSYVSFVTSKQYASASNLDKASAFYDGLKASSLQTCKTSL